MSCANNAPPLGLSWGNVTVSDNGKAVARGIGVGIGNPPQIVALAPTIADDNTWVFNAADCVSAANASCIGAKGGVFNKTLSRTYVSTTQAAWNGTYQPDEFEGGSFIFFNDELSFGADGSSLGFPLYMDQPGWGSQSGLGIGPNSSFLKAAVKGGLAPSTSFGLWVGSRSYSNPVDGALWIGGYDSARVASDFTVFPSPNGGECSGCVQITNITYINKSGSTSLFSNDSETITVTLEPFSHVLQVPSDVFANFLRASGGKVATDFGLSSLAALPNTADLGSLSVTFSNGYHTIIPSRELFSPPRGWQNDGTYAVTNNSYQVSLLANSSVEAPYLFDWGIPILTMNYMIMNYDNNSFSLAPARQGAYGISNGALVQPLCKGVAAVSTSAGTPTQTNAASVGATPASATSSSGDKSSHSNVGAIAGGVVGGIVGLAIIAVLVFFLVRSKKKQRHLQLERDSIVASTTIINSPKTDRSSHVPTSPTEISEADHPTGNINQWIYGQHGYALDYSQDQHVQTKAYEMPADRRA